MRVILSVVLFVLYYVGTSLWNSTSTIMSGRMAGLQFENDNLSHVEAISGMNFFSSGGLSAAVLVIALLGIWWKPLMKILFGDDDKGGPGSHGGPGFSGAIFGLAVVAAIAGMPDSANAYYDKADYAEPYFVLPNESAFFIPDVGANKDSQVKLNSADYFSANKIATKRFLIPHNKLENSGLWSNFYVPSGRLIVVDRTPYTKEWTASKDRGTSAKNESIPCQSAEGIDVTVEVAVSASVHEEDAAKFLYFFGTEPVLGDRSKPEVVFQSIYQGKSLGHVMDSTGRGKVLTLICREITARSLVNVNKDAAAIMDNAEKGLTKYFADHGISLDYIGWAGTFSFNPKIQSAIDDKFVGDTTGPIMDTLARLADIEIKRGLAEGLKKGLNFLPQGLMDWINKMISSASTAK